MTRITATLLAAASLLACAGNGAAHQRRGAEIHHDLGVEALRAGRAQEALQEFDQALKMDEKFPEASLGRGLVMEFAFGRLGEAEKDYRRALLLRPDYPEAHNNLGQLLAKTGRAQEALAEFDLAIADLMYREPYVARCNKGQALYRMGRRDEGLAELRSCVSLSPALLHRPAGAGPAPAGRGAGQGGPGAADGLRRDLPAGRLAAAARAGSHEGGRPARRAGGLREVQGAGGRAARGGGVREEPGAPQVRRLRRPASMEKENPPTERVAAFSTWLARERELRGLSRDDVLQATRLAPAVVDALERGEPLPPRAYLLGYLRTYAAAVGLDADEVVLRFEEAAGGEVAPRPARRQGLPFRRSAAAVAVAVAVAAGAAAALWLLLRG